MNEAQQYDAAKIRLLREWARRFGRSRDSAIRRQFTDVQRAVYSDTAKFRSMCCGGRAGKTLFHALDLSDSMARHPRKANLYLSLSRDQAANIIWTPWEEMNDKLGLGLTFTEHTKRVDHPNGAYCLVRGADTKREINKYRGIPTVKVKIDEAQSFNPALLEYLVEDVLTPRTMDYDGQIDVSGTPGPAPHGYWFDISAGSNKGWSRHAWDARQNPHVNAAEFFAWLLEKRGWDEDNPRFRREYLGEWVLDMDMMVWAFMRERNVYKELPQRKSRKHFGLAIDFGAVHSTAWSVICWYDDLKTAYIERSFKKGIRDTGDNNAPSEVADVTKKLIDEYHPEYIVGDLGGLGKAYAQEMMKRHGIAIMPAKKDHKRAALEICSDAFLTGHLLSNEKNESLHRELESVQWDELHEDIAPGQVDDEAMSVTYNFRACPAYAAMVDDVREGPEQVEALPAHMRDDYQPERVHSRNRDWD